MRKYFFLTLLLQFPLSMAAQELYTDYLQKKTSRRGNVVLHQSKAITDMVNGVAKVGSNANRAGNAQGAVGGATAANGQSPLTDSLQLSASGGSGQRVRANGYRIQVFSGGNSRDAKTQAYQLGQSVKELFPELVVYTQFISPHWKCRVGDFRTFEEANNVYTKLKETQRFREAVIVKSKINVYY